MALKGNERKGGGLGDFSPLVYISSTNQGGHLSLARMLIVFSYNSFAMHERTRYLLCPTHFLGGPTHFWPNLADSALAPPILSGVQRLDLSLVQPKVSVSRNREVSAAGRLLLYCGYGKVSWYN